MSKKLTPLAEKFKVKRTGDSGTEFVISMANGDDPVTVAPYTNRAEMYLCAMAEEILRERTEAEVDVEKTPAEVKKEEKVAKEEYEHSKTKRETK